MTTTLRRIAVEIAQIRAELRSMPKRRFGTCSAVHDDGTIDVDVPAIDEIDGSVTVATMQNVRVIGVDIPAPGDQVSVTHSGDGRVTYDGRVRADLTPGGGGTGGLDARIAALEAAKLLGLVFYPEGFSRTTGAPVALDSGLGAVGVSASGGGGIDSVIAINAAITAAGAVPGGIVWFSKPFYGIGSSVLLNVPHVSLQSATTFTSHLKPLDGFSGVACIYVTANDCSIDTFAGQGGNSDYTLNAACDFLRVEAGFRLKTNNVGAFYMNGWVSNVQPSPVMSGFATDVAANTLTKATPAHWLDNGQQVTVTGLTANTTGGIVNGGTYYVVNRTTVGGAFQLALTVGGAPIDILGTAPDVAVTLTSDIGIAGNVPPREIWMNEIYGRECKAGCRWQSGVGGGSTWSVSLMADELFMDTMLGGPCFEILDCHDIDGTNWFGSQNGGNADPILIHGEAHVLYLTNVDVGGGAGNTTTGDIATVRIEGRNGRFPQRVEINAFTLGGTDVGVVINGGSQVTLDQGEIIGNNGSGARIAGGDDITLSHVHFDNNNTPAAWVSGSTHAAGNRVWYSGTAKAYVCILATGAGDTTAPNVDTTHWQLSKAYDVETTSATTTVSLENDLYKSTQVTAATSQPGPTRFDNDVWVRGGANKTTKGMYETVAPQHVYGCKGGSNIGAPWFTIADDIPPFAGDKFDLFVAIGVGNPGYTGDTFTIASPETIVDATLGPVTLNLPDTSGVTGQRYLVSIRGTVANLVTINAVTGQLINSNGSTVVMEDLNDFTEFQPVGVHWRIIRGVGSATTTVPIAVWSGAGPVQPLTGTIGADVDGTWKVARVVARLGSVGSGPCTIDIKRNGVSILSSPLTLAPGDTVGVKTPSATLVDGDVLTCDVLAASGTDLSVTVHAIAKN